MGEDDNRLQGEGTLFSHTSKVDPETYILTLLYKHVYIYIYIYTYFITYIIYIDTSLCLHSKVYNILPTLQIFGEQLPMNRAPFFGEGGRQHEAI